MKPAEIANLRLGIAGLGALATGTLPAIQRHPGHPAHCRRRRTARSAGSLPERLRSRDVS